MPEQIKKFVSFDDLKLLGMALSLFATVLFGWYELKGEVSEIQIRNEVEAQQVLEQVEAVKGLTKAVQELTLSNIQLQERLKYIERRQIERLENAK